MTNSTAARIVPRIGDLPGEGWSDLGDELFSQPSVGGAAELFDCVGPDFPEDHVVATASSPHFVRAPRQIVHGLGVSFGDRHHAERAADILAGGSFAECLGRAIAADFEAQDIATEMLAVDVAGHSAGDGPGRRVTFTGADAHGVQPVHLDIVVLQIEAAVAVLWFGDTPAPFDAEDAAAALEAIRSRVAC